MINLTVEKILSLTYQNSIWILAIH